MSNEKIKTARLLLLQYLKKVMAEKGITQEQVAQRTGFTQGNVSRILGGRYSPSLDNLLALCEAIDCFVFVLDKAADDELAEAMRNRWGKRSPS